MDKYVKIIELMKDHHVVNVIGSKDKQKCIEHIALFIDAVIFNMVSMFCLIAIINNSTSITDKTLDAGMKYLDTKCHGRQYAQTGRQSGGDRQGSATFLGIQEPVYQESNVGNDVLFVDFNSGLARPQIGGMYKPDLKLNKFVKAYVKEILQYHNITAKSAIKEKIVHLIKGHIDCLIRCIFDTKKKLTLPKLKKIIKHHHWLVKKK